MYYPNQSRRRTSYPRRTKYVPMLGAIEIVTQEQRKNPGNAREAINFEPGIKDGFRRIDGYERFDGRAAPSAATWHVLELTDASDRSVGDTITGSTSGATGEAVLISGNYVVITALSGNFQAAEETDGNGDVVAAQLEGGGITGLIDASLELAAQDYYRDLIGVVPGSGSVLGVWRHLASTYAFRNNSGGTAAIPHKASGSGWSAMSLYHKIGFDAGTSEYEYGDTITASGASTGSGTVKKVVVLSGTWAGSDAAGFMMVDITSGTFADNATLTGGGAATQDGDSSQLSFSPSGRFEFISYNFYGGDSTYSVYGCDGVNPAFEIDQNDVITPIVTGSTPDTPKYLVAHKYHLILAIGSSVVGSKVGVPYNFNGVDGAFEKAVGAPVTGLKEQPGDVLTVATSRQLFGLYGETVSDFQIKLLAKDAGAKDYSFQTLGYPFALDDRGVVSQQRVEAYGNFEASTITQMIQPIIDAKKSLLVGSSVLRKRNQIRLYFSDMTVLVLAMGQDRNGGMTARATTLALDHVITCVCNAEDENGNERVFFGSTDGYVYEAEKGFSFDGENIEEYIRLNFYNPFGDIRRKFKLHGLILNVKADADFTIKVMCDLSYAAPEQAPPIQRSFELVGGGGFYDTDNYDEFNYDVAAVVTKAIPAGGTGTSVSWSFYQDSNTNKSYEIEGYTLDYSPRGLVRAY